MSPTTSARPISRRSISIAIGWPARSGGFRSASSAWRRGPGCELAHHLGRALQLTNILRDLDEDAAIGRLYLPRELLVKAGIATTDPIAAIADPRVDGACRALAALALDHFAAADRLLRSRPRGRLLAPRLMGAVYRDHAAGDDRRGLGAAAPARPHRQAATAVDRCAVQRVRTMTQPVAGARVHVVGAGLAGLSAAVDPGRPRRACRAVGSRPAGRRTLPLLS